MFQLTEFVEATVASVTNRTEAHGDDRVPAVSIGLEITASNIMLDMIDPKLRESLYKAVEGQEQLPGIEPSTPVLRCSSIDHVVLTTAHEGWTLQVDDGIDETTPMTFGGVKVDKMRVEAKQGGSIVLRFRVGTSDIDAERAGALAMHNQQSILITLRAPAKPVDAIDGSTEAFEADHPGASASDLFAAEHGGPVEDGTDDDGSGHTDVDGAPGAGSSDDQMGKDWPFPRDGTEGQGGETGAGPGETTGADAETPKPRGRRARKAAEVE